MWQKMLQVCSGGSSKITPIVKVPTRDNAPYTITEIGEYLVFYSVSGITSSDNVVSSDSSDITITQLDRQTISGSTSFGIVTYKIVTTSANRTIYGNKSSNAQGFVIIKIN